MLLDSSVISFLTAHLGLYLISSSLVSLLLVFLASQLASHLFQRFSGRHPSPPNGAVFITGCSSGIGRTAALRLASKGLIVFAGVRKLQDAEVLKKDSGNIVPVLVDVVNQKQVKEAVGEVEEQLKKRNLRLIAVVNNAGISLPGLVEIQSLEKLKKQYEVNVFGAVSVTQAFLPLLRKYRLEGHSPRVIMISSTGAKSPGTGVAGYCSTKKALEGIVDGFRTELSPWGIEVISLQPGPLRTPMQDVIEDISFDKISDPEELQGLDQEVVSLYRQRANKALSMGAQLFKLTMATTYWSDEAVEAAVFDKWPRTRYDVGWFAYIIGLTVDWLPNRVLDVLMSL